MDWYLKVLKNYFNFEGRARRKEYWMYAFFNVIIAVILAIVDTALHARSAGGFGVLGSLYALAVLVPGVAVATRRLHDIDRSGWWQLLLLIPLVGWATLIVWTMTGGDSGDNRFGPDPKLEEHAANAMA